jgi:hypothetical protein
MNSWSQLPHIVSRGGQKNFVALMKDLAKNNRSDWEPDPEYYKRVIARILLYKQAESSARQHKFPGYRANAVAYTLAAISYRTAGRISLDSIWEKQECSPALSRTIHEWMPTIHSQLIETAGARNVTEWCKKEECWRHVQTHGIPVSSELEAELAEGQPLPSVGNQAHQGGAGLTSQQRENIARTMQPTAKEWLRLCTWGAETGKLEPWQVGISGTLATYAAKGWVDVPSAKQAAQAVKMLQIAADEGAWLEDEEN